jgi:hypothetical protein
MWFEPMIPLQSTDLKRAKITAISVADFIESLAYSSGAISFPRREQRKNIAALRPDFETSPSTDLGVGHEATLDDRQDACYRRCAHLATFEKVVFVPVFGWPGRLRRT